KEEQDLIDRAIDQSLDALPELIAGNAEKAMMRLHTAH
ncbi:aminoacyl-tRNA hydrolase, partial [Myxococcus sp. AM009]|nr:aminoacyl-tRNA hydrolase [Myxococcus sp. AM009]